MEFYGDSVMNEFERVGQRLTVNVTLPPAALKAARGACVRVGLLGSDDADRMVMQVGGHSYQLASGTWFQEIPLRHLPAPGRNTLVFQLLQRAGTLGERPAPDQVENRLRVSSVSVVVAK